MHLRYLFLFLLPALTAQAQQVIINELYNSATTTDEWVELLVVQDNTDLRGWTLSDFTSTGGAGATLTFSTNALWSSVAKGTIIVVGQSGFVTTEDTDPSDFLLLIKGTNAIYFSGAVFQLAGSSDAIQLMNAASTFIFGVSWGTANAASLPSPKAHFASSLTSGNTIYFNEDTTPELTNTANWTFNTATSTRGAGNTALNIAWINTLRSNTTGDGSGKAGVNPDTLLHGTVYSLDVTYTRDTAYTVTDLRIILPSNFSWSHDTSDVILSLMSAAKAVTGDTVTLSGATFDADSAVISIADVVAPDSTAFYSVRVQSKALAQFASVTPVPQVLVFGVPQPIADVKGNDGSGVALRLGQMVTIRGIVTVANQFGGPSYLQDNTGGIAIFGSSFSTAVATGDEVIVSGKVDPFNGLTELTSPYLHEIVGSGNNIDPAIATCAQLKNDGAGGVEAYEGLLVRVNSTAVRDTFNNPIATWGVAGSGTNYRLVDGSGYVDIRVDNGVDFANTPAPQGTFDILGVMSQFKSTSPFIGGYQLMPRASSDILSQGPLFATLPVESNITPTSFTVSWTTVYNGTTRLRYGTTTGYELGVLAPDDLLALAHAVDISGLQPATIYHVQAFSVAGSDTSTASDLVVSTASPAAASGQINVYFNKTVNTSVSTGETALGSQNLISRALTRINNAHRSVDVCLYSLSGSGEGDAIATALVAAKARGVKVRVICENSNSLSNAFQTLQSNGIPLITDTYDPVWGGQGLMHNKFFVFDYRGGAPESVWAWGGSWNPTDQGTNSDRQNAVEMQDVAVAGAYTAEFNEMWGSSADAPNSSLSRFGARKTDNTPHHFVVDGTPVSLYFSPSDRTTSKIGATLRKAAHSVSVAILTFTRKDLADTVIGRKGAGAKTRVVMDNNTDLGNQYSYLLGAGVDLHLAGGTGLLHHKYAVVDGDQVGGDQYLVTGSHNWSNSAENSNDENTLIFQSSRLANLYLQEFAARYYEAGGTDSIHVASAPLFARTPSSINFGSVNIGASRQDSFSVTNGGTATLSVTSASSTLAEFTVNPSAATVAPGLSATFIVTFTPAAIGVKSASILLVHNAAGSPDTVSVEGTGLDTAAVMSVPIAAGWNMLSVPLRIADWRKSVLYPSAVSNAFAYEGTYVIRDTLRPREGFWLKYVATDSALFTGASVATDTFLLAAGWNLIGSLSVPVPVSSITGHPPGNGSGPIYSYVGNYQIATTLDPGQGFWVKASQDGYLVLSGSSQTAGSAAARVPEGDWLALSDAAGHSSLLVRGGEVLDMPPLPPQGAFDARCSDAMAGRRRIELQGAVYPLRLSWGIETQTPNLYTLIMESPGGRAERTLTGDGELTVQEGVRLSIGPPMALPSERALGQNYPNPFNPSTVIPFALPERSRVSLVVLDVLGREVMTILAGADVEAGFHTMPFDASGLASGLYFYRLTGWPAEKSSERFVLTKKLMIVK